MILVTHRLDSRPRSGDLPARGIDRAPRAAARCRLAQSPAPRSFWMSSLTLCVGGRASVGFVDVPPPAARLLRARFGTMAQGLSRLAPPVTVRFSPPPVPRSSLVLTTAGVRVAADDGRRLFLLDQDGRRAQLPASANDEVLLVDPAIDARPYRTLHQLAERLLEWQVERQAMVALKGAAAVLPKGRWAWSGSPGPASRRSSSPCWTRPPPTSQKRGSCCPALERWPPGRLRSGCCSVAGIAFPRTSRRRCRRRRAWRCGWPARRRLDRARAVPW